MVCLRVLTGLVLLCVGATAVAAPVYRWTDERGVQHFSDVPPAGVKSEAVDYSNVSVIPMFGSDTAASAADESVAPACEPDYSGDEVCETGQQGAVPSPESESAPESAVASPDDGAAATRKKGEIREDVLESQSEKLSDYDKQKRIDEIREERELRKERRLTPGERKPDDPQNDAADRIPKTVAEKLRKKNLGEPPE